MDELEEVRPGSRRMLGEEVLHLAPDQAPASRGVRELPDKAGGQRGRARVGLTQDCERPREERVARQERGRLVKGAVRRGPAPPKVVVVHARQVVVDQGIGVHALDGHGGPERVGLSGGVEEPPRRQHEDRPQALSSGHHRVAHGLVEPGRRFPGPGQEPVNRHLHARRQALEFLSVIHG